ncbi:MAG TPA: DNA polymerase III subunit gamma/tau, partial [Thiolapillus brandeum]|nr:DNA polymerase III subunit gamma/tau [Thiolapillus brandeum]
MSYQVLARKWRPRDFSEMVGQEHVVRALSNALDNDRLHHAYLFTGTRGVGKTTLARILAKSLNCEKGVSSTPCGECSICREVDEGRFADLLEVDAASRTKVDQTRELLENVPFAPIRGRYKVYLIDEVHMFSDSSFNALLKTLEEPPPHVKFLLATTDPQKVPVTVLSRCLQLNLKRLPLEQIRGQFEHILQAEGIEWEAPALALLARAADGSMRDGLSLLDQAISFGGGRVREADVKSMLGILAQDRLPELMRRVAEGDAAGVLAHVAAMAEETPDFTALLKELVALLHRVALLQAAPGAGDESWGDLEGLRALAGRFHPEEVQLFYEIALRGQRDLPLAPDPRSGFEMVLLRMLAFRPEETAPAAGGTSAPRAKPAVRRNAASAGASGATPVASHQPERPDEPSPPAASSPPEVRTLTPESWHQVVAGLKLGGISAQLASHCFVEAWDGRRLVLGLDPEGEALRVGGRAEEKLRQALESWLGSPLALEIEVKGEAAETPARRSARKA